LATRFAAKEAVFKAIAHFTKDKGFDFRIVETLNEADGYPVVQMNDKLRALVEEACVAAIHISMTTEKDFATAFVVAESL
jgi:holo-[acyl-carrier-protein] synthase